MIGKLPEEWLKQADYDMETAEFMFRGGRYFYSVFMCHLAVEKSLKGLYRLKLDEVPPKTHNLVFLLKKVGIKPPEGVDMLLVTLTEAQVDVRYPDDMAMLQTNYTKSVKDLLANAKEVLKWIKMQF
ncbi:MAG: HEPN domain-containing protein [Planctomycetota bacterium]|nr:HEPN domain-containing protein [Planctomycetota bacterium]